MEPPHTHHSQQNVLALCSYGPYSPKIKRVSSTQEGMHLPPCVDNRAAVPPDDTVVPPPRLRVDRLPDCAKHLLAPAHIRLRTPADACVPLAPSDGNENSGPNQQRHVKRTECKQVSCCNLAKKQVCCGAAAVRCWLLERRVALSGQA